MISFLCRALSTTSRLRTNQRPFLSHSRRLRFNRSGLKCPPNGADANLVLLGELGNGRALAVAIGNDLLLAIIQSVGSPKLLALALGALDTLFRALADQATLLGNAAHDGYLFVKDIIRTVITSGARKSWRSRT